MAGIGMYGVYYAKAVMKDGVVTGYTGGVKTMGKAISADFQPGKPDADHLYANNGAAESNASGAAGGTLKFVLDRLNTDAAADMFGMEVKTVTVTVGDQQVEGHGLKFTGTEVSAPLGVAFIRQKQEDNIRSHEVVLYRRGTFSMPALAAQTIGENGKVEWKTPELEGDVAGLEGDGTNAWYETITFPTQPAAYAYIQQYLTQAAPVETQEG